MAFKGALVNCLTEIIASNYIDYHRLFKSVQLIILKLFLKSLGCIIQYMDIPRLDKVRTIERKGI